MPLHSQMPNEPMADDATTVGKEAWTLTPMALAGQFILCKNEAQIPDGWIVRKHGDWYLASHPTLPVADIVAIDGVLLGWMLGWPISPAGALATKAVQFPVLSIAPDLADRFESSLYEYSGRFAAVCLATPAQRFYLDACGSLAAVYCAEQQIVASTPTLVPPAGDEDCELIRAVMVPGFDNWYPFGLTPRRGVARLLPNHFLDLQRWESVRHWPAGEIAECRDVTSAVSEFADIVKRSVGAVAQSGPFYACLTGGRDSRVVLACSRQFLRNATLFTVAMPTPAGQTDSQITKKISRQLRLDHRMLRFQHANRQERALFAYRTGGCVDGLITHFVRTLEQLDSRRPTLWGVAGELGRSFHWRAGDTESSQVSARDLFVHLARIFHPLDDPQSNSRAEQWLATLPVQSALSVWGLLYHEQYNGCWQGPLAYGNAHGVYSLWPLCRRRAIEIMLSLPADYRRRLAFERDVITGEWPELLDYPFNWPMGVRRCVFFVSRRARTTWNKVCSWARNGTSR
jgi:hypothetical protein